MAIDTRRAETENARMLLAAIALASASQTCTIVEQRCRVGASNIGIACQPFKRVCKSRSDVASANISVQQGASAAKDEPMPFQASDGNLCVLLGLIGLLGLLGLKKV